MKDLFFEILGRFLVPMFACTLPFCIPLVFHFLGFSMIAKVLLIALLVIASLLFCSSSYGWIVARFYRNVDGAVRAGAVSIGLVGGSIVGCLLAMSAGII